MKFVTKVAVLALTLVPVAAAVAQRPVGTRQRTTAIHDRSPRIRERAILVRTGR